MEYYWLDPTLWPDPIRPAETTKTPDHEADPLPDPDVELEPGDVWDPLTGEPWKWLYPSL